MNKTNKILYALISIIATTAYIARVNTSGYEGMKGTPPGSQPVSGYAGRRGTPPASTDKGERGTPAMSGYKGMKERPGMPKGEMRATGTLGGTDVKISKEPEVSAEIVGTGQKAYSN